MICLIWFVAIVFAPVAMYALVPFLLYVFSKRDMFGEMLIGFFFILLLSDNLMPAVGFAKSFKNVYIVLLALFFFLNSRAFVPYARNIFHVFIPFFIWAIFCLLFSETFVSVQKTASYILLFLLVPNYVINAYRRSGDDFLRNLVFFLVLVLGIGVLMIFINREVAYLDNQRFRGLLGSPNGAGLLSVLTLGLYLVVNNIREGLFSKADRIVILAVIVTTVLLCGSRNSVLAALLLLAYARFYKISALLGFAMFLITILLYLIIENNIEEIVKTLGLSGYFRLNTLSEGSGRFIAWAFAWEQVEKETLFIGKGFGYDEYFMRPYYRVLSKLGHQGGVHNSFLSFWLDMGLVGLLIFLRSYLLMFIKAAKRNPLAFPVMFSLTFTAIFESWLVGSLNPFTIILVIIATLMIEPEFYESPEPVQQEEEESNVDQLQPGISKDLV